MCLFKFIDYNDQVKEEFIDSNTKNLPTPDFNRNVLLLISILINKPTLAKDAIPLLPLINKNKNRYVKFFIFLVKKCNTHKEIDTNESLLKYFNNTKLRFILSKISKCNNGVGEPVIKDVFKDIIFHIYYNSLKNEINNIMILNKKDLSEENKKIVCILLQKMHTIKNRH